MFGCSVEVQTYTILSILLSHAEKLTSLKESVGSKQRYDTKMKETF